MAGIPLHLHIQPDLCHIPAHLTALGSSPASHHSAFLGSSTTLRRSVETNATNDSHFHFPSPLKCDHRENSHIMHFKIELKHAGGQLYEKMRPLN